MTDDLGSCLCVFTYDDIDHPVLVSLDDFDEALQYRWQLTGGKRFSAEGYRIGAYAARKARIDGLPRTVYLHRWVAYRAGLLEVLTVEPGGQGKAVLSIDHINGNKLDNRRSNLRVADRKQQANNPADGLIATNTSGHEGVSFTKNRPHYPWYAYGDLQGKTVSLGTYVTLEEAVAARKAWEATRVAPPASGRIRSDNTTGVRGVHLAKRDPPLPKPWFARAFAEGKIVHLGYFATKDEAAAARKAWNDSH